MSDLFGNHMLVFPRDGSFLSGGALGYSGKRPEVIKLFSCSTQLRLKFILLINVKMPTVLGLLKFASRINYRFW